MCSGERANNSGYMNSVDMDVPPLTSYRSETSFSNLQQERGVPATDATYDVHVPSAEPDNYAGASLDMSC